MDTALQHVWNRYRKGAEILLLPERITEELLSFKVRTSCDIDAHVGGKPRRLKAVRVGHRRLLTSDVFKGGNRFCEGITLSSVESHAAEMSIKGWQHDLPYGGAKGGINFNPRDCTPEELKEITFKFVDELNERKAIGPFIDVPAPDMGTDSTIMFWMAERYGYLHRGEPYVRGVVTGKPFDPLCPWIGGMAGRTEATGYGLWCAFSAVQKCGIFSRATPYPQKVIIQGFGNVGMHAAIFAHASGMQIIAVSDEFGATYNPKGLDLAKLIDYSKEAKTVKGFPGGDSIDGQAMLELPCDILVPAATEEVLTEKNADRIKAKVILEGANGPTTPEADAIFENRGILVIPDVYANSGGVVVSYFEWAMNTDQKDGRAPMGNFKTEVLGALSSMMKKAGSGMMEKAMQHKTSLRMGAYLLALEKAGTILGVRRGAREAMERYSRASRVRGSALEGYKCLTDPIWEDQNK